MSLGGQRLLATTSPLDGLLNLKPKSEVIFWSRARQGMI